MDVRFRSSEKLEFWCSLWVAFEEEGTLCGSLLFSQLQAYSNLQIVIDFCVSLQTGM
jgi:hypothetical protein